MIFGTWSIAHPAKDCGDLQTAIETRRDIFRREMMFVKKQQRIEQLRLQQQNNNVESTIESPPTTTLSPSTPTPTPSSINATKSLGKKIKFNTHIFEELSYSNQYRANHARTTERRQPEASHSLDQFAPGRLHRRQ